MNARVGKAQTGATLAIDRDGIVDVLEAILWSSSSYQTIWLDQRPPKHLRHC
jgi:hypothetical protein